MCKLITTILMTTLFATGARAADVIAAESKNDDVQTLQAWRTSAYLNGDDIDLSDCRIVASSSGYDRDGNIITYDTRDCTAAFEELIGLPSAHVVRLRTVSQSGATSAPWFRCAPTHIRTVTKEAVLDAWSFRGIGFYHNESPGILVIGKDQLHDYGRVILKDGTRAQVHGFFSFSKCWRGSASSSAYRKEQFKPFAEFGVQDGLNTLIYRQWENVEYNHALGQLFGYDFANRLESFDRQADLLRQ